MAREQARPRGRRTLVWSGLGVVTVLAVGAALALPSWSAPQAEHTEQAATATAAVARETLVERSTEKGALGFGATRTITGTTDGTVTWLPEPGTVLDRGAAVARVDDRPVVALHGAMPLYRALEQGVRGPDVRQLKDNLEAMGYGGTGAGDRFTAGTAKAVRAWQKDLGRERTGRVAPGDVVVLPGAVRVATQVAALGDSGAGELLSVTGTEQVVTFDLPVADRARVAEGDQVALTLPGGAATTGTVTGISAPQVPDGDDEQDAADRDPVVRVTVRVDDPDALGGLDAGPVDVGITSGERADVLTVPVTALLALAEGGYAVERVAGDGSTTLVPVTTGMFAGGRVEVAAGEGADLAEGDDVVVPA